MFAVGVFILLLLLLFAFAGLFSERAGDLAALSASAAAAGPSVCGFAPLALDDESGGFGVTAGDFAGCGMRLREGVAAGEGEEDIQQDDRQTTEQVR